MSELRDQIRAFHSISLAGLAVSAIGAQISDQQWIATSLSSGNRFSAGNDTSAGNANHRITQLIAELIRKGILQGTVS